MRKGKRLDLWVNEEVSRTLKLASAAQGLTQTQYIEYAIMRCAVFPFDATKVPPAPQWPPRFSG